MKTSILYIFARTPVHVGAGSSVGAIDMPVQRERHTQIPVIPGSSLKGVLRDLFAGDPEQIKLFGPDSNATEHAAGDLLVGEARVVCFPVRSAKGSFAWLTCPAVLARYSRDAGKTMPWLDSVDDSSCCAGDSLKVGDSRVVLEEYSFVIKGKPDQAVELLKDAVPGDALWLTVKDRLVIVSDGIFTHFCATACEVQQRIRVDDQTGTVAQGGLFNQENVPSETLFYAVMGERKPGAVDRIKAKVDGKVIQVGGDETIGLGFCTAAVKEV